MPTASPTASPPDPAHARPRRDLLATPARRRALFALLYFLEGAPIGFVWWALPPALHDRGWEADEVGALLALLALPWALKLLWAPLVDALRGPRWTERGWILAAQAGMVLGLLPLVRHGLDGAVPLVTAGLVLHAFAAATQDVAIDALAIRSTTAAERASLNAWMNAGMLTGRAVFSAGALGMRAHLGDEGTAALLVAALTLGSGIALLYRPAVPASVGRERLAELLRHARAAFRHRRTWRLLAFAATGGAGFEAVGAMLGLLVKDAGGSDALLAGFYALPAWVAPVAGGFAGGWLADRYDAPGGGHRTAVFWSGLSLALAVLGLALASSLGASPEMLLGVAAVVYVGIGAFTASSYAMFMDGTDPALGSTQFSAYMGATNLCESWSARSGGWMVTRVEESRPGRGYAVAFAALAAISVLALTLLPRAREASAAAEDGD